MITALAPGVDPCQARLLHDLQDPAVDAGIDAGLWRIVGLSWPALSVTIGVDGGQEFGMRLDVQGYPAAAPAGQPWDLAADALLPVDRWPVTGRTPEVFRKDWADGRGGAPYLPCDRIGLATHPNWATDGRAWNSSRTIAFYLQELYRMLCNARLPTGGAP
jgi:hypothetical protein